MNNPKKTEKENRLDNILNRVDKVTNSIDKIQQTDVLKSVNDIFSNCVELKRIGLETKRIDADIEYKKNKLLADYSVVMTKINLVYNEREKHMDKYFEIIDKGLENNDLDMISRGLLASMELIKKNPFSNFSATLDSHFDDEDFAIEM